MTLPNGQVVLGFNRDELAFLYDEIFVARSYWRESFTLGRGDCVFDIGANIGLFTLWLDRFRPGLRIHAFEPIPVTFAALRCNVAMHAPGAKLVDHGIGARDGAGVFTHYPRCSGWSTLYPDPDETRGALYTYWRNKHRRRASRWLGRFERPLFERAVRPLFESCAVTRPLRTLSAAMRGLGVERIDLLKIDVERGELDVLAGLEPDDWLNVRQIVVEVEDGEDRLSRVRGLLERHRFAVETSQAPHLDATRYFLLHAIRP